MSTHEYALGVTLIITLVVIFVATGSHLNQAEFDAHVDDALELFDGTDQ